jgi:hypothetical protein
MRVCCHIQGKKKCHLFLTWQKKQWYINQCLKYFNQAVAQDSINRNAILFINYEKSHEFYNTHKN